MWFFMGSMHFWFLFRTNEESMSVCNTCYVCMSEHMPDLKLHWYGHYWLINIERRLLSFIVFAIWASPGKIEALK